MPRNNRPARSRSVAVRTPSQRILYLLKRFWPFALVMISALFLTALLYGVQLTQDLRSEASNQPALLKFEQSFAADWFHVNREGVYDYAPNGMIEGNNWRVWTCGGHRDANGNSIPGDWIFHTSIVDGAHRGQNIVLSPSANPASMDSLYACAPSVVLNNHPHIQQIMGSGKVYMMHYECAPRTTSGSASFAEICVAYSNDGTNWRKFNRSVWDQTNQFVDGNGVATSVIKASGMVRESCGYVQRADGMHELQRPECLQYAAAYGSGHPSTVLGPHDQIWMWYYDSGSSWDDRGVRLVKSWDGFNFSAPIKTNLKNPIEVARMTIDGQVYYVALTVIDGKNVYLASKDGIVWGPSNASGEPNWQVLGNGAAIADQCGAPSQAAILTDPRGNVSGTYVNIYSAEGFLGPEDLTGKAKEHRCYSEKEDSSKGGSRGSTWGLRVIQGHFRPAF